MTSPSPSRQERRRQVQMRRRGLAAALGVVLVVVVVYAVTRPSHPGGDPGGTILKTLEPVASAVPTGSTGVTNTNRDSVYATACRTKADNEANAGWSPVLDSTVFSSTLSYAAVVAAVGKVVQAQGWTSIKPNTADNWQFLPLAEWQKHVSGTESADVSLINYPRASYAAGSATKWLLGAEAKTTGFALPGC
jgi:hypothetical protein